MINLAEPVANLMVQNVLTVGLKSSLLDAADIFDLKHIHQIPVVEDGELVGLISKSEFLFFRHRVQGDEEKAIEYKRLKETTVRQYHV